MYHIFAQISLLYVLIFNELFSYSDTSNALMQHTRVSEL